jgi:predicted dehydrogenase
MMDKKYGIAIVGTGMWGYKYIEVMQKNPRTEVSWVSARTEATVRETMAKFGVAKGTTDYREALADPAVDLVVVSSPPFTHMEIAIASMKAGKHTVIEKPMAITPRDVARIVAEAKRHPDLMIIETSCRHTRLQPKFPFIKQFIDSGKLGTIYFIHHNHLQQGTFVEYNPKGSWGLNKKLSGGGPFFDWGAYDFSFHLGLLGDKPRLKKVVSFTRNDLRNVSHLAPVADVEQHGAALLEFDAGLKYYYERGAGVHCETMNETRIYGTKGGIRFHFPSWDPPEMDWFHVDECGKPLKETLKVDMKNYGGDDLVPFVEHLVACLDGKEKPMMPVTLAAKHMDILFRILK